MNKLMMMVAFAVMLQCAAAQTAHVVGDSLGWGIPQNGDTAYINWAASNQFMVGDILIFNFATNQHDVQQVQRDSFDACTSTNTIGNAILTGPANITLTSAGENYYICTFGSHCLAGQRLAINVSGTPSTSPPSTPTTPTPAARSPNSNSSPEDACPPSELPGSPRGAPTGSNTPGGVDSSPDSSSPAAFASFFVISLGIAMAIFV